MNSQAALLKHCQLLKHCLLILTIVLTLVACTRSPTGRSQLQLLPDDQMSQMGASAFEEIKQQTPVSDDEDQTRYVQCVAEALTETLDDPDGWEMVLFDDESINAFALPGKKIGVYTGLLEVANDQDQLAAVIGHEIGHVLAEHSNARVSADLVTSAGLQVVEALVAGRASPALQEQAMALLGLGAQVGVLMPYGRGQEREADIIGLDIMADAGFRPEATVDLWQNMAAASPGNPPELLSTHPSPQNRMAELEAKIPEATELYRQARDQGREPQCSP